VNVTPDKRESFLTEEAGLLKGLKATLQALWGVHDQERAFQVRREGRREGGREGKCCLPELKRHEGELESKAEE
jgi:hypothetical protein